MNLRSFILLGFIALLACLLLHAQVRCCSVIVPRPTHYYTQYIVTDRWAYCLGRGLPSVWVASTADAAWRWAMLAESRGHCVDVYGF